VKILSSTRYNAIVAITASFALAACAGSAPTVTSDLKPTATGTAPASAGLSVADRDLTPDEKQVIMHAIGSGLTSPATAKYHWTKFPTTPESDQPAYCATVDGASPHGAYSGHQAYIVDTKLTGGHITAAALGILAGGPDFKLIVDQCATHGLDPRKAS
jgi:hypothetical protein